MSKTIYYPITWKSVKPTDEEIDKMVMQARVAEEAAVETMRQEADLAKYEQTWREMYESEIDWR
jgi:hypothetical protein